MNSRAQAWLREPLTRHLTWTIAFSVMIAALLWPALWNGFPIVFDDTGGCFLPPLAGSLLFRRSAFFLGFLLFFSTLPFLLLTLFPIARSVLFFLSTSPCFFI